jgi:hypothetical protein
MPTLIKEDSLPRVQQCCGSAVLRFCDATVLPLDSSAVPKPTRGITKRQHCNTEEQQHCQTVKPRG